MNKFLAWAGLIVSGAGALAPVLTSVSPKVGACVAAVGLTAQAVTPAAVDLTALWRKALGKEAKAAEPGK